MFIRLVSTLWLALAAVMLSGLVLSASALLALLLGFAGCACTLATYAAVRAIEELYD